MVTTWRGVLLGCIALMLHLASVMNGVKVSRNAIPGPGNLSLERSGCKIIGFPSRSPRSWAQQVSSLRYSNPIVNESFKVYIFYDHKFTVLNGFIKFYKIEQKQHEIMLNTFSRSLII